MTKHRFVRDADPKPQTNEARTRHPHPREYHETDRAFDPCPECQGDGTPCGIPENTCETCGRGKPSDEASD